MILRAEIPSVVVHMRHDVEKMKRECVSLHLETDVE